MSKTLTEKWADYRIAYDSAQLRHAARMQAAWTRSDHGEQIDMRTIRSRSENQARTEYAAEYAALN